MTTADGSVLGTTKIVDHGPATAKWNLVLVAEGYQSTQMAAFATDAQAFVDYLFQTPPFDEIELQCAINVYRVDVTSTDSGADDPATCGTDTAAGTGATPATYFDATFCADGVITRLLSGNQATVADVVNAQVPEWDQILVIVNDAKYGGAGGTVAFTSVAGTWQLTAIHEMGHSAFGLADEYPTYAGCASGETGHDNYTGSEPSEPNITADTNRATIKWGAFIDPATPLPTTSNADCTQCDPQGNPFADSIVGAYEGAGYFHCGLYRPQYHCMMIDYGPFCAVCTQRIRDTLQPYLLGSVTLDTPSITFNDVPEGETTVRAVVFAAQTCTGLHFEIVSGPTVLTGPPGTTFTTPLGASAVTTSSGAIDYARLWIGYTGTTDGDVATGTVRVRWVETGDEWDVPITAETITRPNVAVVLVLDKSASMNEDAGDGRRRIDVLHESAVPFVDLIQEDNAIGVVAFDQDPHPVMDVTPVGPLMYGAGRLAAQAAILAHTPNPAGLTAIGDGVEIAHDKLAPVTGYDVKAMIVLTDGQETEAKYIADVLPLIDDRVFAIGLGTAEQIQPAALTALTNGTGGYLLMTGTIDTDDYFRLSKYYLQILAGVTNADIVLDPEAYIAPGQTHRIPFRYNETDIGGDVILLNPAPNVLEFRLEAPDGTIVDPTLAGATPGIRYVQGGNVSFYRAVFPLPLGGGSVGTGEWTAILTVNRKYYSRYLGKLEGSDLEAYRDLLAHGVRYSLSVHAFSNLRFTARLDQTSQQPGATMTVTSVLTEYGLPVDHRASVDVELQRPNGTTTMLPATETGPGVFEVSIVATMSGIYTFTARANGTTLRDRPFTREQIVTGAVWRGGDGDLPTSGGDGPGGHDDWICEWLKCLFDSGVISRDLEERLAKAGFNLDALRKCLKTHCRRSGGSGTTTTSHTAEFPGAPGDFLDTLRRIVSG